MLTTCYRAIVHWLLPTSAGLLDEVPVLASRQRGRGVLAPGPGSRRRAVPAPRSPTFATIHSTASFGTRTFVRLPHHVKKIVYNTARRTFQFRNARRPRSLVCPFVLGLVVHNQPRRGPGKVEAVRLVAVRTVHLLGGCAFDGRGRERDGTSVSRAPANFRRGQRRALLKLAHSLVMQSTPSPFFASVPSRVQEADTAPPMSSCSSGCKSQSRSRSCERACRRGSVARSCENFPSASHRRRTRACRHRCVRFDSEER